MPFEATMLKTIEECQLFMTRAILKQDDQLYEEAFGQLIILTTKDKSIAQSIDSYIRDSYKGLLIYEEIKKYKNPSSRGATRTRQKLAKVGLINFMTDVVSDPNGDENPGFSLMLQNKHEKYISEYLIVKYEHLFKRETVGLALLRLRRASIKPPPIK